MAAATNSKGYAQPDTGSLINAWGPVINGNFATLDNNLAGIYAIRGTSGTISLTPDNMQYVHQYFTDTLTADTTLEYPHGIGGFYFLEYRAGTFTLTVASANSSGATITLTGSGTAILYTDGTNITNYTDIPSRVDIPAGTMTTFIQSAAPDGWTLSTAYNDRVLRLNNSSGGGTGGAWALWGVSVDSHALSIGELPPHAHSAPISSNVYAPTAAGTPVNFVQINGVSTANGGPYTANTGSGWGHTHGLTADGTWRPAFVDAIVCTRDS